MCVYILYLNWIRETYQGLFERNKILVNYIIFLNFSAYIITAILLLFYVAQECWDEFIYLRILAKILYIYILLHLQLSVVVVNLLFLTTLSI